MEEGRGAVVRRAEEEKGEEGGEASCISLVLPPSDDVMKPATVDTGIQNVTGADES